MYLAGIVAGQSSTPEGKPTKTKKRVEDDEPETEANVDDVVDDVPDPPATPGPASSGVNAASSSTPPIRKKEAMQQAAVAAASSTPPPTSVDPAPTRTSTPRDWRDRLTARPKGTNATPGPQLDDDVSASTMDLVAKYDTIQREFTERRGAFDVDAVKDASRWFHFEPHPGVGVWPVPYTKLNLPNDCTRLVVLMLEDAPAVAAAGAACAREVMRAMGSAGVGCFNVPRSAYHVTVFFLSLPTDPVADPTTVDGKSIGRFVPDHAAEDAAVNDALRGEVDVNGGGTPVHIPRGNNGSGSNGSVGHEGSKGGGRIRENAIGDVTLEVDRVAMAKSGSLLLLFRDPDGTLDRMRRALRGAFPGAPSKQTTIAHCTLLRCFPGSSDGFDSSQKDSSYCLDPRAFADVNAACARWTHRLAGARVKVSRAWLVREERFSSVDGPRSSFHL